MSFSIGYSQDVQMMRLKEVMAMTGLSRSTIYNLMDERSRQYDPTFPKQIPLTLRTVSWNRLEVEEWIHRRMVARDSALEARRAYSPNTARTALTTR